MELAFRVILFVTGVVNFLPSLLAVLPSQIKNSYGVAVPDQNYELLLRHRAVLFAIVGGLMMLAALTRKYYTPAALGGLISMGSFVVLFFAVSAPVNAELTKVMKVDIVAFVLLLVGFTAYSLRK